MNSKFQNIQGNGSYFPLLIQVVSDDSLLVVETPEDIPSEVSFKVLECNCYG